MEETKTVTVPAAKKSSMNPIIIVLVVLIVLGGFGYMMINSNKNTAVVDTGADPSTAPAATGTESATTGEAMSDIKTIEIEAGSFYYKPNTITVKKGQRVKIVMKSVSMQHDFNIDELHITMPLVKNGETGTVEFTADKAGTFEYYCSVGQHRTQGQVGQLIVEE